VFKKLSGHRETSGVSSLEKKKKDAGIGGIGKLEKGASLPKIDYKKRGGGMERQLREKARTIHWTTSIKKKKRWASMPEVW